MRSILIRVFAISLLLTGCATGPYAYDYGAPGYAYDYGPSYYGPGYYDYYGPVWVGPPVVIGGYYHGDGDRYRHWSDGHDNHRDFHGGGNGTGHVATHPPQWNGSATRVARAPTSVQRGPRVSRANVVAARPQAGRVAAATARHGIAAAPERSGS
jgi:hypothetical protein